MTGGGLRKGLPVLPARMRCLALDSRGYPVPFFVEWVGGRPDFTAVDGDKWVRCVKYGLCWICGEPLGRWRTFVLGPKSAEHQMTSEPPSHLECAQFAVQACPFIVLPRAKHRGPETLPKDRIAVQGVPYHNPGAMCLWTTDRFEVVERLGNPLLQVGIARGEIVWYTEGRVASADEIRGILENQPRDEASTTR